jgi:SAM-dependent methyltransferase/uncharacterized protein YbaR (Trm112 family)
MTLPDCLRCPACGGHLSQTANALGCSDCGDGYPIIRGTPRLLRGGLREELLKQGTERQRARVLPHDAATRAKLRTAASFGFEWKQFPHLRPEWERNFLDYMQPHGPEFFRGKRVLDAGCGTGRHAYHAALFGAEVVAVDLSDAIDVAHEHTRQLGRVCTVQADLDRLPFAPESFDFIYSFGVLHHLHDPEAAFQKLLGYLKPGGEIRVFLYWCPEGQPVKRVLLSMITAVRSITTRLPHRVLYWLSYPLAAAAYAGFIVPYRVLRRVSATASLVERLPMKQYASYPFQVCVNDQFDRFSAPIENRYTRAQVRAWLERAGLQDVSVSPNWGWLGSGRKPGGAGAGATAIVEAIGNGGRPG